MLGSRTVEKIQTIENRDRGTNLRDDAEFQDVDVLGW